MSVNKLKNIVIVCAVVLVSSTVQAADLSLAARVEQAMNGAHRSDANIARNRYRHPVGTLTFFGIEEGMTVLEAWPGGGWYTEVLAPALRHHGQFIVADYDIDVPDQPQYRYRLQQVLADKFAANPEVYDQVAVVPWSPPASNSLGEAESVDVVLTFRALHGWVGSGIADAVFAEFARVLKPGGILGVVQHRAPDSSEKFADGELGYLSEAAVIELARQAGLYLDARSEVNANPADTHEHEIGVWALPPGLNGCDEQEGDDKEACLESYRAIGESDRMTLRFRKPVS